MKEITLTLTDGQTWIYPAKSYTDHNGVKKIKNHWYKGHSISSNKGRYCYQGGISDNDGSHNGNMLSMLLFEDNHGNKLKTAIKSIGGSERINKITLKIYINSSWGGYFAPRICMTPYWNTSSLETKTTDSYDGLDFKYITTTGNLKKGAWHEIDLTNYKHYFDVYESLAFYCPGAYNARNNSYGSIHSHLESNPAQLIIECNTDSKPKDPTINIHTTKDSNGYITPELDFSIDSDSIDKNNEITSYSYSYKLFNKDARLIKESNWSSNNRFNCDLTAYRGQVIKIRGFIKDSQGLSSYNDKSVYINSTPYWDGINSEEIKIDLTCDSTKTEFLNSITMTWPKAIDAQSQHNKNLRYSIYAQVGTDKGPKGDTDDNCIASNLTDTSFTIDTLNISKLSMQKGERVYFSVWVSDGLEKSTYRLTSDWIYKEQALDKTRESRYYRSSVESSITISWPSTPAPSGLAYYYHIQVYSEHGSMITHFDSISTSLTYNVSGISRGSGFYFKIWVIDEKGIGTIVKTTGMYYRNSPPSTPFYLRVNSDSLNVRDVVPLKWGASSDPDGDTVRYNLYYSVNNGGWRALVTGTLSTSTTHVITAFEPGTELNYCVEAYDSHYAYSGDRYISSRPVINVPPEAPEILLPFSDRTLYTNTPRIIFKTDKKYSKNKLTVSITINGVTYTSSNNSSLFDKTQYNEYETGTFTVPLDAPLNYSKVNTIKIKVNDGIDSSPERKYNFIVESTLTNKIEDTEDRLIKASDLTAIKKMINLTRFAYGLNEVTWDTGADTGSKILKKFYEQASNNIHEVTTMLNSKTTSSNSKRIYTKDSFKKDIPIKKTMFNKLIDMITKP